MTQVLETVYRILKWIFIAMLNEQSVLIVNEKIEYN